MPPWSAPTSLTANRRAVGPCQTVTAAAFSPAVRVFPYSGYLHGPRSGRAMPAAGSLHHELSPNTADRRFRQVVPYAGTVRFLTSQPMWNRLL